MMQIKSGEVVVDIQGPEEMYEELRNSDFAASRIPEFEFTRNKSASAEIEIEPTEVNEAEFRPEEGVYEVKGNIEDLSMPQLTYLIFSAAEREREKEGVYTFHGSGVSAEDGVLFLGHPNSGKTASSLTMALDHGYNFVGDDRVMVNEDGEIAGGNKLVPLNEYNFEFLNLEEYGFSKPAEGEEKTVDRSRFGEPARSNIGAIVFPELIDEELDVREMSDKEATFRLFQDVSHTPRTTGYALLEWDQPYPSFDSEEMAEKRYDDMKSVAEDVDVLEMYGRVEDIASWVNQRY